MSDTIIKIANKTENFTIVSNEVPRTKTMSARAKGVYFYLMTLPKDWKIHKEEIYSHFTEGRSALEVAWNELKSAGYIEKEILRENGKISGTLWKVYETHRITENPSYGKQAYGKPSDGKQDADNQQLLSTDELSTNSTNDLKTKGKSNDFRNIYDTYIAMYKNIYGVEPVMVYNKTTKILKELLKDLTSEQIIHAIAVSEKDKFSKDVNHDFCAIMSGAVIGRLVNTPIQYSSLPLKENTSATVAKKCPTCGSHLDQFNTCPKCHIEYDVTGRAI